MLSSHAASLPADSGFFYHRGMMPNPAAIAADAVLAANQAFYDAFNARDMAAMEAIWSREAAVSCIHPGWPPLVDREPVLDSWRSILANPHAPQIMCEQPSVVLWGEFALVLCLERLGGALLAASNLYRLEAGAWRLLHHQAGPAAQAEQDVVPPGQRLH
jgi:ketosteroid isomerase-like protein